ncbi:MAG: TatD family hydrolase [Clostridiales Family XIII bacterium]|jgi:TatD DNase family protein|nr:TatD family hydrolase [Clostridiales Family XIII bacterium]
MLFDSHTHLNNETYTTREREELAAAIEASPVSYVVDVGFDLESSALALSHAKKYPWCWAAAGCHPHSVREMDEDALAMLKSLAKNGKVVAIGEIGLDYNRGRSDSEQQQYWFKKQLRLALEMGKPIIVHDREAGEDVLRILKEEGVFSERRISRFPENPKTRAKDARLLLHCYSGDAEQALRYIKLGATISIAGPVTYKNARKTVEVVEAAPIEHLLVETDAPYLTPEPLRGRPNASPFVEYTARKVAAIKEITYEEAARATCENAKRFFGIE